MTCSARHGLHGVIVPAVKRMRLLWCTSVLQTRAWFGIRGHKAVVFALDEFDAFARPQRQTLLYSLLDALQACQVQVSMRFGPRPLSTACCSTPHSRQPIACNRPMLSMRSNQNPQQHPMHIQRAEEAYSSQQAIA